MKSVVDDISSRLRINPKLQMPTALLHAISAMYMNARGPIVRWNVMMNVTMNKMVTQLEYVN